MRREIAKLKEAWGMLPAVFKWFHLARRAAVSAVNDLNSIWPFFFCPLAQSGDCPMRFAAFRHGAVVVLGLCWFLSSYDCAAQKKTNFEERHKAIKERFEKRKGRRRNSRVQKPPMIKAADSDLAEGEPVIGVFLAGEARAYPLTMMFGGGGIFELLNDTCGGLPIAASW